MFLTNYFCFTSRTRAPRLGTVVHAFNPSTWEEEAGGFLSSRLKKKKRRRRNERRKEGKRGRKERKKKREKKRKINFLKERAGLG